MNERNENTADTQDQAFTQKAKEVFDLSVQRLDAETRSRLNRSRHEAMSHAESGVGHSQWLRWAPATGAAAAALFAVVVLTGRPPHDELTPPATVSDFEMLLDQESFEMLEELEFYTWLDLEGEVNTNGNVG